jgi:membrane-associated phospholipid phosphatase
MRRYLLAALWPAGEAAIAAATVRAARRAPRRQGQADRAVPGRLGPFPELGAALPGLIDGASRFGSVLAGPLGRSAEARREARRESSGSTALPDWAPDLIRLGVITGAGGLMAYEVMKLIGPAVIKHGPAIDEAVVRWTDSHQVKKWAVIMERLGKIGNTWTTWGAAGTAAVCLAASWRDRKWLPPAALGTALLVDHYVTIAIRRKFGRPGPPDSPGGTYPSGGCDRVVLFYGLIAYLIWREFSGSQRGKIYAIGTVAALSFNEAYSREYLSKHWLTDIVTGLLYGGLLLAPSVAAVRLIAGPVIAAAEQAGEG